MRGKVPNHPGAGSQTGITPAYAGKSRNGYHGMAAEQDHPRVCGEKEARQWPKEQVWGSPPRMRGKDSTPQVYHRQGGITPAYAGKSFTFSPSPMTTRDHPRVCGEKFYVDEVLPGDTGSPPRMRGKAAEQERQRLHSGITPAYAGKSYTQMYFATTARDHPRVCGEKIHD